MMSIWLIACVLACLMYQLLRIQFSGYQKPIHKAVVDSAPLRDLNNDGELNQLLDMHPVLHTAVTRSILQSAIMQMQLLMSARIDPGNTPSSFAKFLGRSRQVAGPMLVQICTLITTRASHRIVRNRLR
jgi:hypothetical protein